jgi:hypothetical protein
MAVSLGCIKTLSEALAYVNAEMPLLTPTGAAAAGPVHQSILATLGAPGSANIDAIKRAILNYQCADRTARGLKCRDIAQALSCADGYVIEPATDVGPGAKDVAPPSTKAPPSATGGVKAAGFPLWLAAGLLVGGVAYYAFAGKKGKAKSKPTRRPARRRRRR